MEYLVLIVEYGKFLVDIVNHAAKVWIMEKGLRLKNMTVNFTAALPLKTPKRVAIRKKEWVTLPEDRRDDIYYYWSEQRTYLRIDIIDNPAIEKLRKLLKKQRVKHEEILIENKIVFIAK